MVLDNGANGQPNRTSTLSDPIGTSGVVTVTYPTDGIQNGMPDGVALVDASGVVRQFLPY